MDITEFATWARDFEMIPEVLEVQALKQIFANANKSQQGDGRHTFVDLDEFEWSARYY